MNNKINRTTNIYIYIYMVPRFLYIYIYIYWTIKEAIESAINKRGGGEQYIKMNK